MELKPEIVKTIKRLTVQNKNEVLKNKLRDWLQTKAFTLDDLLYNCVEGHISLTGSILNKMGTLYSLGQEGFVEDTDAAFALFEIAAELGHSGANGNCAQYYFDGRAPDGKNIELAYQFCKRSIELGADKYMLMGEILYDQNYYAQTVQCLHHILDKPGPAQDRKKKVEARDLERECLMKQLNRVFHRLNTFEDEPLPTTTMHLLSPDQTSVPQPSPSPGRTIASASFFASPRTLRSPRTSLFTNTDSPRRPPSVAATTPRTAAKGTGDASLLQSSLHRLHLHSTANTASASAGSAASSPAVRAIELPGWVRISEDLDGFDRNTCTQLTARAELLELEAHALRTAYETAQDHLQQARRNHLSEEVIQLLQDTKVSHFHQQYEVARAKKDQHLTCWDAYTDTQEHILRRQLLVEQAFFNPRSTVNQGTLQLAVSLLKRRSRSDVVVSALSEPLVLNMLPTSRQLENRIPSARSLLTAEKALLDVATALYEPRTYTTATTVPAGTDGEGEKQVFSHTMLLYTGWTGEHPHHSGRAEGSSGANSGDATRAPSPQRLHLTTASTTMTTATGTVRNGSTDSPGRPTPTTSTTVGAAATAQNAVALRPEPSPAYTAPEQVVLDDTTLRYRLRTTVPLIPTDHNVHQSGFVTDDVPSSEEILQFFNKVTMVAEDAVFVENEKMLAQLLLRFTHDGKPMSVQDLQLLNPDLLPEDKIQMDCICMHYFVHRVVKWLVTPCTENQHLLLPMASIQARTLQLIAAGIITFAEAFAQDGLFGVFYCDERTQGPHHHHHHHHGSNRNGHHHYPHFKDHNHNHLTTVLQSKGSAGLLSLHHTTSSVHVPPLLALRNKAKHINALYQKYIVELQQKNFLPTIQYWKQHTTGATVPTYKLLYGELARCYGGELDDTTDLDALCGDVAGRDTAMTELLQRLQ